MVPGMVLTTRTLVPPAGRRPRVVVDPGHGGSNSGASGIVAGAVEKEMTLILARKLRDQLVARGIDVELTRDGDRTLILRQRVALANRTRADAFISIHTNASMSRAQRGFETFVLTPAGLDIDGRALRADDGALRPGVDPAIARVLDDVERGAALPRAADLAAAIQAQLAAVRGRDLDRGVRQDAHHVLLGATMPAVLVEVGFLDHPLEGRELVDPGLQDRIAIAIATAIAAQLGAASCSVPGCVPTEDVPTSSARSRSSPTGRSTPRARR